MEKRLDKILLTSIKILQAELPYLTKIIQRVRIYRTKDPTVIAAIDRKLNVYINEKKLMDFIEKELGSDAKIKEKVYILNYILLHEILHFVLGHIFVKKMNDLKNIAMDAEVNYFIDHLPKHRPVRIRPKSAWDYNGIREKFGIDVKDGEPWERIYNKMPKEIGERFGKDVVLPGEVKGEDVIWEGELTGEIEEEDIKEVIVDIQREIINEIMRAGHSPGKLKEIIEVDKRIENILEGLRNVIYGLNERIYERSYTVENRRDEDRPGYLRGDFPVLILSVDTSGSMPPEIISKILGIASQYNGPVILIEWDAKVQNVGYYWLGSNIPEKLDIKGRGGTSIRPTLELILNALEKGYFDDYNVPPIDGEKYVIIASDFYIIEEGSREKLEQCKKILENISELSRLYLITSGKDPKELFGEIENCEIFDLSELAARYK